MEGVEYHIGGVGCSTYAGCKIPSVCRWLCGCLSSLNKRRLCNCQDQSVNGKKVFFISFVPWSGNVFEVGLDVLLVDRKSRSVTGNCVVVSVVVLAHHRRLVVQGIDVRGAVCGCRCQRHTC